MTIPAKIPDCTTLYCPRPGTVPGIFRMEIERDGEIRDHHVTYCRECARSMHADGLFFPDNEDDIADTPELSEEELAIVERFETAPPVCLSCDEAEDTIARVLALADSLEEPVFRAAVYRGERDQGRQEGEDAERLRIAIRLRKAVKGAA
jgi:hypothetical protein